MGIQAVVVFIGLLFGLAAGVLAGTWYGDSPLAGWLAVGSVPVVWGVMHLIERVIGREIWYYTAPYPYSPMQATAKDGASAVQNAADRFHLGVPREQIRLAA